MIHGGTALAIPVSVKHRKTLALVLVFAAVFAGAEAFCIRADQQFGDLRSEVEKECNAYRAKHPDAFVCHDDPLAPSTVGQMKPAREHLARAREAADRGDRAATKTELVAAMDIAARVDRRKTLIAELVAASIAKDAIDIIETKKLDHLVVRAVLFHAPDTLGAQPTEALRVDRNQRVVSYAERNWFFGTGVGESLLRSETKENDRTLGRMGAALRKGDLAACQAAMRDRNDQSPLAPWTKSGIDEIFCGKSMEVQSTAARLDRLRRQS